MYSLSNIAVDRRIPTDTDVSLGFDFSDITNLVKSALPATLNIFQNQMKLNQIKAMSSNPYALPVQGLPAPQMYGFNPQQNIPQSYSYGSGISTTTILAIGGALVLGLVAFKLMK